MAPAKLETKNCALCGRVITWRKKWAQSWQDIKFCSDRCRGARKAKEPDYEQAILALLRTRARGATVCPSEVLNIEHKSDAQKMEQVRQAARRLVHLKIIEILQRGRVVDPSQFKGPIRLRLLD